jgi:hypothetical protein
MLSQSFYALRSGVDGRQLILTSVTISGDGMKRSLRKHVEDEVHDYNNRVQWGWSHWISPYISMLSVVSLIEILMAKLIPEHLVGGTLMNITLFLVILYSSYWFGKHHEDLEAERARHDRDA